VRTLILAPFDSRQLLRLRRRTEVVYRSWLQSRKLTAPDELSAELSSGGFAVVVVEADFVFDETIEAAECLRLIGVCRGSTNGIDVESATERGILVVNTPGRNAQAVAEHALGLMLALARSIPSAHEYVRAGRWQNPTEPYVSMRGVELAGRTLGIVGLGAIGRRTAAIGSALGMKVLAYDPYVQCAVDGVVLSGLEELMKKADFVSVHVPLTPETEGLLDRAMLSLMRDTAFLVNCSDSAIVEQAPLVEALAQRRIAGAALDVFETHPVAPDNPLLALDNVVLSPHLGGATQETIERHSLMMTDDVLRFLDGQRPVNLVNPDAWDIRAR
jgi:phosphoglycerate dehydrogenase-like enzyme